LEQVAAAIDPLAALNAPPTQRCPGRSATPDNQTPNNVISRSAALIAPSVMLWAGPVAVEVIETHSTWR
jgi:hypothetical protein